MNGRFKFKIKVYYENNDYLCIDDEEKILFEVDGYEVKMISLTKNKKISESEGFCIECDGFTKLNQCINLAKKVYTNLLIKLNDSDISYDLYKYYEGNFCNYCKDKDNYLYKEIIIIDKENIPSGLKGYIFRSGCGCPHFNFIKLENYGLDQKLKKSLQTNNYRKYLVEASLNTLVDNTLFSASLEQLLDSKKMRSKEEINAIDEVVGFLNEKQNNTNKDDVVTLEAYEKIKSMILNNKNASINDLKKELIRKNSSVDEVEENLKRIDEINNNRALEIHNRNGICEDIVFTWPILNKIQREYAKDIYNDEI